MNKAKNVNVDSQGAAMERQLAGRLRDLLGWVTWLKDVEVKMAEKAEPLWDLAARIPLPGGKTAVLAVECKKELRPSQFPMLAARFAHALNPPSKELWVPVLALPWISPRMAELCAEYGWSWYDLAGNCHLDVPSLLRISRSGHEPVHEVPRPRANLASWGAAGVISTLLNPVWVNKTWTQREMTNSNPFRDENEWSLGLVNKVVRHLEDQGYIKSTPGKGFQLTDPMALLMAWREAYRFEKHERLSCFTLWGKHKIAQTVSALWENIPDIALAAFSAADYLAPHVRQPKTWVYVSHRLLDEFLDKVDAKTVDSGENLVVLVPADECVLDSVKPEGKDGARALCTGDAQTYVDLWHCGSRGQEAAEAILEQRLKPVWRKAGFKT